MKKTRKTTIGIDEDLIYKLKFLALKKRITLTKLFNEALEIGFNDLAKKFQRESDKTKSNQLPDNDHEAVEKNENLINIDLQKEIKNSGENIVDRFR